MNADNGVKRVLHIEEGYDYFLESNDELPYTLLRSLGHGGCAHVEEVQDRHTGAVFARKVFRLNASREERKLIFENEVKVIRRLGLHHHITRVFATYVGRREVGLILTPVASRGSLDMFLQDVNDGLSEPADVLILYRSFGCLASGLQFMHAQKVRHKDIKPSNILVHNSTLIYTDFDASLDYSAATGSTTTGRPNSMTRRYAAPELHEGSSRNSKTDIFSLGCVYLEILCAITSHPMSRHISPYKDHLEEVHRILDIPRIDDWIATVVDSTRQMLHVNPRDRPSARSVKIRLSDIDPTTFCELCKMEVSLQSRPDSSSPSIPDMVTGVQEATSFRRIQETEEVEHQNELEAPRRNMDPTTDHIGLHNAAVEIDWSPSPPPVIEVIPNEHAAMLMMLADVSAHQPRTTAAEPRYEALNREASLVSLELES